MIRIITLDMEVDEVLYKTKHFSIKELVSHDTHNRAEEANALHKLWYLFDTNLLLSIDRLREFLNCSVSINTWAWGGDFNESGFRDFDSNISSIYSQHRRGNAADLKFKSDKWTPEKLREHMLSIGAFEEDFCLRTDAEAYPFVLLRQIEWIGKSYSSLEGEMSWFHAATNPDIFADKADFTPSNRISVIGAKGQKIIALH